MQEMRSFWIRFAWIRVQEEAARIWEVRQSPSRPATRAIFVKLKRFHVLK